MGDKALQARREYNREATRRWREKPENKEKERAYRQANKERYERSLERFYIRQQEKRKTDEKETSCN